MSASGYGSVIFESVGIRFEHPADWEVDEVDDEARVTITVQSPHGPAFAMITLDGSRPAPAEMVDEAVAAMREEYTGLESTPAVQEIDGHKALGQDLEFFSLDLLSGCAVRAFRTPRRTVLIFAQWSSSSDEDEDDEATLRRIWGSIEETETDSE